MKGNQKGIVLLPILIIIVLLGVVGYFVYQNIIISKSPTNIQPIAPTNQQDENQINNTIENTQKQVSESLTFCQQDSDCMLVYPFGSSVSSCCWGCLTFSINKNEKGRYDELFSQECKEIECPPYAPGAACFPYKAVCANNECQAVPEEL